MSTTGEQQCYNRGCGNKYNPQQNTQDSCTYHPGTPFFHDAYKGWSCCKKKTVDFTEFLNTKGCTRGFHSNVKPLEPEKPKNDISSKESEQHILSRETPPKKVEAPAERPPFDAPMVELSVTVSPSLSQQLDEDRAQPTRPESGAPDHLLPTTVCQHGGCNETYASASGECCYHSGVPIFHEGMKYWSCCQRKTSDFSAFLAQQGCTTGDHLWVKKKDDQRRSSCRYDWHQTAGHVTVAVYAKRARPNQSRVEAGPIRLKPHIVFDDNQLFELDIELSGAIDTTASSVQLMGTKVEIKLKKAEARTWCRLSVPARQTQPQPTAEPVRHSATETITERVDAVDLRDL